MESKQCKPCGTVKPTSEFYESATVCKPCRIRQVREYNQNRGGERRVRNSHLRRKYGITIEHYEALLESQGGLCAICRRPERNTTGPNRKPARLAVDHCHTTGKVRGLLCFHCNSAIGKLDDNPHTIIAALSYVLRHKEQHDDPKDG